MERKHKVPKKSVAPKIKDLDARQRRLALLKQKQCDTIALYIVSRLIDSAVEEDVFLQSLKYINQCHYQDIVEERAISKMCGYPICSKELPDMPKKKYHISTKLNKVYDITDRKHYCSNFCFQAGIHIKEQMFTSPLWYRDKEEFHNFELLPTTERGIPGIEIEQGLVKVDENKNKDFTSVPELTENLINDLPDDVQNKINIDCENANDKPNDILVTEPNDDYFKINDLQEDSAYFSNNYTSSLADILKQNAEYFTDESKKLKNNVDNNIRNKDKITENKNFETNNINEDLINSKANNKLTENGKIQKDKILKKHEEIKSILYKDKISSNTSKKKRVSFNSKNDVIEIEKIDYNSYQIHEKKIARKEPIKYKNLNVIGSVQEKSNVYKYQIVPKTNTKENVIQENKSIQSKANVGDLDSNVDIETDDNFKATETYKNNEIKQDKSNIIKTEASELANNKENRLSRLKNSSSYKKVNRMGKIVITQNENFSNLKSKLQKCAEEWCTIDTFIYLYGEEYVKNIISETAFTHYTNKKKNFEFDDKFQKKYNEMCKRLNIQELADKNHDESVTGKKLRSVPRFEELRDEAEKMDLKVQAFYSGGYEEYEEDCDSETESTKDENEPDVTKGVPAVLPLVDNKDFNAIRRKIFLTSLSRSINVICEVMKLSPNHLLSDIKQLIDTFEFSAHNIVFKTKEWQLVIVLLVKLLANKDKQIEETLNSNEMTLYINSLIEQFNLKDQIDKHLFDFLYVGDKLLDACTKKISIK